MLICIFIKKIHPKIVFICGKILNDKSVKYFLKIKSENAYFQIPDLIKKTNSRNSQHSTNSFQRKSMNDNEKFVLFCDINEKDFEYTKRGYKLLLVVYSIKQTRYCENEHLISISKKFAGGLYDLGSNLCNIVYVSADIRNFQASMIL